MSAQTQHANGTPLTRDELLRKAEQHDNAAYLAFSDLGGQSDPERAKQLWGRRDEYAALAALAAADADRRGTP